MNLIYNATSIPSALMFAASNEQDFLCRIFGRCLIGDSLDREVHNLIDERNLEEMLWQLAACGTPAVGANLFHCPHSVTPVARKL
jgi:hypothetical protein